MLKTSNSELMQHVSPSLKEANQNSGLWNVYLPYFLIAVVITVGILLRLSVYPLPLFDEGFTTHVAHVLVEKGIYGTYGTLQTNPFDPFVSSGPPVVLPVAMMFRLFGVGSLQARLALFPYSLLLGLTLYTIARYLYGQTLAFLTVLLVLVFFQWSPRIQYLSPIVLGRHVLGEVPAVSMILFGFWVWFKSWEQDKWSLSLLAGVICGIGLLSKMQTGFGLLPALFFIALFRTIKNRREIILNFAPLGMVLIVAVAWLGLQRLSTPANLRAEYSTVTTLAIIAHYFIGLFGRVIENRVIFVFVITTILVVTRLGFLVVQSKNRAVITHSQWAELTLISFAFFYLLWFATLSVGWERYLFPAFIIACLPAAKLIWDGLTRWFYNADSQWIKRLEHINANVAMIALSSLALVLIVISTLIWTDPNINSAQQLSDYIRSNIPQEAVIESLEWEIDAPSGHLNFHHPESIYVIDSILDYALRDLIVIDYDFLKANPDYLILGHFSHVTGMYRVDEINRHFELLKEFGLYRLYKRI